MAGIQITPAAPTLMPEAGAATSTNDGQTITMPTVAAPSMPKIEGEVIPDAGDAAEIEVVHHFVGSFRQGARLMISELGENVDLQRLIRLGAVKLLKAIEATTAAVKATKGSK